MEKELLNRSANGQQWLTDRAKLDPYSIHFVPRVIIIDRNFIVTALNGPSPADPDASVVIDRLIK